MRRQIVEAAASAGRPLTLRELQHRVPGLRREDLDPLVEIGLLHPCPGGRYWDRDETAHFLDLARQRIAARPQTRRQLVEWLGEVAAGRSRRWREALYARLREEPGVYEWPPGAGQRASRLATRPPDPDPYLSGLREQFERAKDRLARAGLAPDAIAAAVTGDPAPSRTEAPEVEPSVLHELAFAWADAPSATARAPLERVLVNIGARRLGEPGEPVTFDGRVHQTDDDLFPDEPAAVVEPGWVHGTAQHRVVLVKAQVRAAP